MLGKITKNSSAFGLVQRFFLTLQLNKKRLRTNGVRFFM